MDNTQTVESQRFGPKGGLRVEERLELHHLEELMYWFKQHKPAIKERASPAKSKDISKKQKRKPGLLNIREFRDTLNKVIRSNEYDDQIETLFTKLDTSCDGYVDWNEFCTYMLMQFKENDYLEGKKTVPFQHEPKIRHLVQNRQETSSKVLCLENPCKYVVISKEGNMSLLDPGLRFERHYNITEWEDQSVNTAQKRKIHYWVTDAVYMKNCHKIAIATTGRDIRFFDVTSNNFYEEFHLFSIPVVVNCMDFWYNAQTPGDECMLICGDDTGGYFILQFLKPMHQLFAIPFKRDEGVQKVFFPELSSVHAMYSRSQYYPDIHPEAVRRVLYQPDNKCVVSCSASPRCSLCVFDLERKKKAYVWRISKGIECFDYKKALNLIVTGSSDHLVRLWNPYVTNKPVAVLEGHQVAIIDIKIFERLGAIFSFSRDAALKVWDVKDQVCLQTIHIRFPPTLQDRLPDYGPFPLMLQSLPNERLLVTAGDYIAQLKMGTATPVTAMLELTHKEPLRCALYNPLFKTVVTGADDSTVIVWELETGSKSMLFANAHNGEEVTCMQLDPTWRRLFTGARDGSIKVWNIQNGHNLHEYESISEAEVTGILPLADRKQVIAVGWNRRIVKYEDSTTDNHFVKADFSWKGGGTVHNDDILSMDNLPPYIVATGSFDGEISVWNLELETLHVRLRKGKPVQMDQSAIASLLRKLLPPLLVNSRPSSRSLSVLGSDDSYPSRPSSRVRSGRPNSRHRGGIHKIGQGDQAPIDKLLFLRSRIKKRKRTEVAVLISCEAGTIHFWSIYGSVTLQARFYAPSRPDESVLGAVTTPGDSLLIIGDTCGQVSVWDITDYAAVYSEHVTLAAPPKIRQWPAHEAASIVSVDYVHHDLGEFVVTASTDCTAKLFTIDGRCVGSFGQKQLWSLKNPATWACAEGSRPSSSASSTSVVSEHGDTMDKHVSTVPLHADNTSCDTTAPHDEQKYHKIAEERAREKEDEDVEPDPEVPTIERGDTLLSISGEDGGVRPSSCNDENRSSGVPVLPRISIKAHTANVNRSHNQAADLLMHKSLTFAPDVHSKGWSNNRPSKLPRMDRYSAHTSFLGSSVEKRFQRISKDRQGRRAFADSLSTRPTNRMGKICCPYQAMAIPEIQEIILPTDLPLSPRMLRQGLSSNTLTLHDVLNRPEKSFYLPANDLDDVGDDEIITRPKRQSADMRRQSLESVNRLRHNLRKISTQTAASGRSSIAPS